MNSRAKATNLKRAIHKATLHDCRSGVWYGCFTPSEIYVLLDFGVRHDYKDWMIEWKLNKLKVGDSSPMWFYFKPNGLKVRESHNTK